ncbi:MAG: spore coat protein [Clostridiales bacterium]|nr:spore coat protein [Clostridiales bacterium]
MDDRAIMEDILFNVKGVCDLYLHGTIESSTGNVHSTFDRALQDSLKMQNTIYNKMSEKGWYPSQQEQPQKIQQVKQKFGQQGQQQAPQMPGQQMPSQS